MIELTIITSLFTFGIHAITREGMIFGFVELWWEMAINRGRNKQLKAFISKPLTECPPCMAFWWGVVITSASEQPLQSSVLIIGAAIGLNYILSRWV